MSEREDIKEDEIDLMELARVVWSKRMFITRVTGIFIIIGLVVAFTSKVEYRASCKLLPESQEGVPDFGGLGGLAGLAGFDLSGLGGSGTLSPELYPEIVNSAPFLNKLINTQVYFEKLDTAITPFMYFEKLDNPSLVGYISEYSIGLPGKIKKLLSSNDQIQLHDHGMLRFSKEDWKILEKFSERLSVSVDSKTGIIGISAEMPDAVASAQILSQMVNELSEQIISYKSSKAQTNLNFINERFNEAKLEYEKKQLQHAQFTDRNRNITTSVVQNEIKRLQNEMDIAFEVYKGMATQLEQAKIKVKEDTPVLTVLEPVRVPEDKNKPKRGLILVITVFVGFTVAISYVFVRFIFIPDVKK